MSDLSTLKILLSDEISDSETVGKTPEQRTRALNNAIERIYKYRNWGETYVNAEIQAVDGVINMPQNMDPNKTTALWFGANVDYFFKANEIRLINQTDFLSNRAFTGTITEVDGIQVIKISEENRGFDANNLTTDSVIGINNVAARARVGQTFTVTTDSLRGALVKLSKVGAPTGTLTIDLTITAAGLPTTSLGSATLNISEINEEEEYFFVKLSGQPITVTENDTLAITITPSYALSTTDYIAWSDNVVSQITGNQVLFDGAVWSAGTGDQGFAVVVDFYNFQYVKRFVPMVESTDDSGLSSDFDEAIAKLAGGLLMKQKRKLDIAQDLLYGAAGSVNQPEPVSAYGILNDLWTNKRIYGVRQNKRIKTAFEKTRGRDLETYPLNTFDNLI